MFKLINNKTNIYYKLCFDDKKINLIEKYDIFFLILKKNNYLHIGNVSFNDKSNKLIFLNKPFFLFVITRIPKPYPFKIIKS